jgi:hypothetical protein
MCPSHRASSAPSSQRLPDCGCRLASTARPGHWLRHRRKGRNWCLWRRTG